MQNLVKLVQANGKALLLPAHDISIVRELEPQEKEKHPNGASAVWVLLNGTAQSAVVRERFGFILKKAGGNSAERVQLRGLGDTRISMPRSAFANALEGERITNGNGDLITPAQETAAKKAGEEVHREDVTTVNTNLRGGSGVVAFHAADSVADIFDLLSTEESDDQGDDEDESESAETSKAPKKRANA